MQGREGRAIKLRVRKRNDDQRGGDCRQITGDSVCVSKGELGATVVQNSFAARLEVNALNMVLSKKESYVP
jgi:hypothetical protein